MNVGNSVRKAIEDWEQDDHEAAMLHACNAVDGSAKKLYRSLGNKVRFTKFLRDNYPILGPMGAPGINIEATRFPVSIQKPTAPGGTPDLADVIYGVHRCTQGHGDELPEGFELIADAAGPPRQTHMEIARGMVRLSDRIVFGLLAVAVFSPVNVGQSVPVGYRLTFGASTIFLINDWWGRAAEFPAIAAQDPVPSITLDFANWVNKP
jgi:hypothetical protein